MESASHFIGLVSFPTPAFTTEFIHSFLYQLSHHHRCLLHSWWPQSPGSPDSPPSSLSLVSISSLRCLPSILTAQPRLSTAKLKGIHFATLSKKKANYCMCLFMTFIISALALLYCIPAGSAVPYTCTRHSDTHVRTHACACTSAGAINTAHCHGNCEETLDGIAIGGQHLKEQTRRNLRRRSNECKGSEEKTAAIRVE